jgi:hypothetical protein
MRLSANLQSRFQAIVEFDEQGTREFTDGVREPIFADGSQLQTGDNGILNQASGPSVWVADVDEQFAGSFASVRLVVISATMAKR